MHLFGYRFLLTNVLVSYLFKSPNELIFWITKLCLILWFYFLTGLTILSRTGNNSLVITRSNIHKCMTMPFNSCTCNFKAQNNFLLLLYTGKGWSVFTSLVMVLFWIWLFFVLVWIFVITLNVEILNFDCIYLINICNLSTHCPMRWDTFVYKISFCYSMWRRQT